MQHARAHADSENVRTARSIALLLLATLLLGVPAADARTPRPYVKSVSPLRASVGEQMTIQGFYFRKGYAENTVVFVAGDGRVSFVKSEHSTRKRLTVIVPQKVERLLDTDANGTRVPTKFSIKVIARRMSRLAKRPLAQPTIGPDVGGDCDHDGTPNPSDGDDDGDLLPDSIELDIRTNPCVADSDGDKLPDGWEYISALDLNTNALPYPGKRPFPNALFSDASVDHDGDGLHAWAEYGLWWFGGRKYPLDYSDGDQTTQPDPTGAAVWNDWDYDGILSDDERDFDNDGLANIYEYRAPDFEPWEPHVPGSGAARHVRPRHRRRRRAGRLGRPGPRRLLEHRRAARRHVGDEPVRSGHQPHLPALARGFGHPEDAAAPVQVADAGGGRLHQVAATGQSDAGDCPTYP